MKNDSNITFLSCFSKLDDTQKAWEISIQISNGDIVAAVISVTHTPHQYSLMVLQRGSAACKLNSKSISFFEKRAFGIIFLACCSSSPQSDAYKNHQELFVTASGVDEDLTKE